MPMDKSGKYHMNAEVSRMHDGAPPEPIEGQDDGEHGHPEVHHIEVHPHGDGTHHTVTHFHEGHPEHQPEGVREDHENMDSVHRHLDERAGDSQEHSEPDADDQADADDSGSENDDEY